jgi:YbbR domain-containing protein
MKRVSADILFRNWALKLIAFALALILWLILVPQDKIISERTMTVPLDLANIPPGMEIVERPVPTVEITVRGPKRILNEMGPATITARLDLERATIYQQEYPLSRAMITLPLGAEVIEIRPNKVRIQMEKTTQEVLQVRPTIRGKVASGYRLAGVEADPSSVTVTGPESRFKAKDTVTTSPIDITGLTETTVFEADLILPKPDLRLASPQAKVRVAVVIEEIKKSESPAPARKK